MTPTYTVKKVKILKDYPNEHYPELSILKGTIGEIELYPTDLCYFTITTNKGSISYNMGTLNIVDWFEEIN
jgi:hypothetical protein